MTLVLILNQKVLGGVLSDKDFNMIAKMHKAIAIMQFKSEAKIIKRHPEFHMENRLLLDKINF